MFVLPDVSVTLETAWGEIYTITNLPLSRMPKRQIELLVAVEDPTFSTHHGFALDGIRKAAEENSRAERIVRGGSTITQQLVKNLYFRFTRSYLRKMSELLIARWIGELCLCPAGGGASEKIATVHPASALLPEAS